ncbi:MAG TPA: chorismate mutase [Pseudonocardia sp.]|jgi:chorismate mutase
MITARRRLACRTALGALAVAATAATAGCGGPAPSAGGAPPAPPPAAAPPAPASLTALADVAVRRIRVGDTVAAAKFGTGDPIDDPAREQQVQAAAGRRAEALGVDPAEAARFFADQIEASKVVQRGLYARWQADPAQRPAGRPDLATEVRPQLDVITDAVLRDLADTAATRHDATRCRAELAAAHERAGRPLDALHRQALDVALRTVCPAG